MGDADVEKGCRDTIDVVNTPANGFGGLLFDMDGTVLSSVAVSERVWTQWARRHGLDVAAFLPTVHGVRAIDTVRNSGVPGLNAEAEAAAILEAEVADMNGIEPIAGASELLAALPPDRWAIVTSAPRRLAQSRIVAAGLPMPDVVVTGDDVAHGKPAPDAFQLGARRLGCTPAECLVFEDAQAGVESARAAGAAAVVVTALHAQDWGGAYPTITDYRQLRVQVLSTGRLRVTWA